MRRHEALRTNFAAVDGQAGRVWWDRVPSMKAEALWPTVAGVQEMRVLDALVGDNAPGHRDADVTDLDLALAGLPAYSRSAGSGSGL